jgi:hypothetical protein
MCPILKTEHKIYDYGDMPGYYALAADPGRDVVLAQTQGY